MSRKDFLTELANILDDDFEAIKFTKTSQQDKADTLLPLLIITVQPTEFNKSGTRTYIEKTKILFTIIIQEGKNPSADLAEKEELIIRRMLTSPKLKQYVQDIVPKKSNASNDVNTYQKQGAVSSELEIEALFAVTY